jgi:hypothetical protein
LKTPTRKDIKIETEKISKINKCYSYLIHNCDDKVLCEKIMTIRKEHLLSKISEVEYSVEIPLQERKRQLEEELKKLKE